jgi:hypothetical protein
MFAAKLERTWAIRFANLGPLARVISCRGAFERPSPSAPLFVLPFVVHPEKRPTFRTSSAAHGPGLR